MLSFSCTNTDTITGNSRNLEKYYGIEDDNSTDPYGVSGILWLAIMIGGPEAYDDCLLGIELFAPYLLSDGNNHSDTHDSYSNLYANREDIFEKSYDFRDNYLSITQNGRRYIDYYKLLSRYSVKNNLINKYYKEHLEITPKAVSLAYRLQHGDDLNELIIDNDYYKSIKDLVKIYRNSNNHREIDGILDKIEKDIEKYYNKPKSVIEADFK